MVLVKPNSAQIAKIKVIGVGGAGGNAVNFMITSDQIAGVEFIAINTDAQALLVSQAQIKVQIGEKLTRGLGAGGNPKVGRKAAEESQEKLKDLIKGADMIFITGGEGGGTCSGAAEIVAQIAREELGILTVAVVTKPFLFEGTRRMVIAEEAIEKLKEKVDTLIIVPNQKLMEIANPKTTFLEAFQMSNSVLSQGVRAISELITTAGLINLDFADIKTVMKNAGSALLGVGYAEGEDRASKAVIEAIQSPLLTVTIKGARGVILNITGPPDLTMTEIEKSAKNISDQVGGDANIIFGAKIDENIKGVRVTVIATGFDDNLTALSGLVRDDFSAEIKSPQQEDNKISSSSLGKKKKKKKKGILNRLKKVRKEAERVMANEKLPEGMEIVNELDIPTFLRKQR
ncbi:MAG: cell division protein FtsZ [Patescibacteria group bacterium]